ncbi:CLUMA_CG004613, isoform A [Clunio marinus]|uniref:CLUMA_CG004613, isoform A n=1 Tax=Clunio marinus TaxID=568069 RepID=A0A1J1HU79_9DIPT|nr:CLUMA_CG004613, isoform A [Clunio marinus]
MKILLLLSLAIVLTLASPPHREPYDVEFTPFAVGDGNYRLNDDVLPESYEITLTPYFEDQSNGKKAFTFDGLVMISMKATKDNVDKIVLHHYDMDVESYFFTRNATVEPMELYDPSTYDNQTDKWEINVSPPISPSDDIILTVNYVGYMRDDMKGFYKSYYYEGGQRVWMASTQFQRAEARRAFPCFDEPGYKAMFKLRMRRPPTMNTVSNTERVAETDFVVNGMTWKQDEFEWTPKMSSYLLAFIVSGYEAQQNSDGTFGVWARPEAKNQTTLALDFGQEMLAELNTLYGIDYYKENMTKMDIAAIPDFSSGAMENWGLLTFRETNVLFYPDDTPSLNEQRIIAVITHEQVHMWFGDLVTCKWWSETWLNEGFARYFQFLGTAMLRTDWELEEQFVVENLQLSMQIDSTDDTHPMTEPNVNTKPEANAIFDTISYSKAAAIIRMLSYNIGLPKFHETLRYHLSTNRYQTVEPDQLFEAIDEVMGETETSNFWAPWTNTSGFPLVTVTEVDGTTLKLTQHRFMRSGIDDSKKELYNIPITYAIDSENYDDTVPKVIFGIEDGETKEIQLPKEPTKYYILNPKQTNFYRINYDEENWKQIREALYMNNHDNIHVMNRAQIVDDLFNLARAGIVDYETAMDIIGYIKGEKHYIPWLSAFSHGLTFLSQRLSTDEDHETFANFIRDMTTDIYDHLAFEPKTSDSRTDIYNRVNILTWTCKYGHEGCIELAKEHFAKFKSDGTKPHKDLRSVVYCSGVREGDESDFDFLYDRFMDEDIAAEQLNLLGGMACTKNSDSVNKYLDRLIKTDDIRAQDRTTAINNMLNSNPEGPQFLYDYITTNYVDWREKFNGLATLTTVAGRFTKVEQFDTYQTFLDGIQTELDSSFDSLQKSLNDLRANLDWDEKYMKDFLEAISSAPMTVFSIIVSVLSFTTSDSRTDIYNRVNILTWTCKYGHEGCIELAKEHFAKFKNDGTKPHKDLRSVVYCSGVREGDESDFDFLYDRFMNEDIAAEQLNLLGGMACTKNSDSVNKYLDRLIKTDDIRAQDRTTAINNMLNSNPEGPQFLYDYITTNYVDWREKFNGLATLTTVAGRFTKVEQFDTYQTFLDGIQTELDSSFDSLQKSLNDLRANLDWDEKYMKDFLEAISSAPMTVFSIIVSVLSFTQSNGKKAFTFDGEVKISMKATKDNVDKIVLHHYDMDVESYFFTRTGDPETMELYDPSTYDNQTDKWEIILPAPISPSDDIILTVNYVGNMRDDMNGFYRSYYYENNEKVWLGSTQLQQTEARRAFPCFDEPGIKAEFKLRMRRPQTMNTISNMNKISEVDVLVNGLTWREDEFDWTPPMSTYLLAFIVSKYKAKQNSDGSFGVWARPEAEEQASLALEFGQNMLEIFGNYLGISYYETNNVKNVTKMDMAAVPDFSAGAMENWGLLTYRETGVLYYPDDTPTLSEQRIVAVIAHEQAHMWFGDLVTCKWWSETWLNEGFARYFQFFGTAMIYDDWELEEQFVVENLQQSMQLDSTDDTHPMTNPNVNTKPEASGIFDNISYNKAACIIRMLSHYIGMEKFEEILNHYLDTNRYESVIPSNLFNAIDDVMGEETETSNFWAPWTNTSGFPLVTVTEVDGTTLKLTQHRFMRSGIDDSKKELYNIPITYAIDSENYDDTVPKVIFGIEDGETKEIQLPKEPTKYYILNPKQTNFYRINYDEENWKQIREALYMNNHDNIHVMNRAQIVDDLFNLARAGIVDYETAMDIIGYIKGEKHYIPWLSAFSHGLTFLSQRLSTDEDHETFANFIRDMTTDIYDHLAFEPKTSDSRTDIYNRVNILTWTCKYGHEGCIELAKEHFAKFKSDGTKPHKDLRSVVYCSGVREGDESDFDFLYDRFMNEDIAAEQLNLLGGMACTKNSDSVNKYLDRLIKTDDIRAQDRTTAINNMLNSNPEGPQFLYDYITTNYVDWREKFNGLATLTTVAGRFTKVEQFDTYQTFLDGIQTELDSSFDSLQKSLNDLRANLDWDEKYMKDFLEAISSAPMTVFSIIVSVLSFTVLQIFN